MLRVPAWAADLPNDTPVTLDRHNTFHAPTCDDHPPTIGRVKLVSALVWANPCGKCCATGRNAGKTRVPAQRDGGER